MEDKWDGHNQKLNVPKGEKKKQKETFSTGKKEKELLEELEMDAEEAAFYQHEINVKDYERRQDIRF